VTRSCSFTAVGAITTVGIRSSQYSHAHFLSSLTTAAAQPGAKSRFTDIDDFFDGRSVYAKSEQVENKTYGIGMCFQTIEYGVSADSEFLMASLAEQILDIFVFAMRTIANQGVEGFVRNQIVGTSWIGTEVAWVRIVFFFPPLPLTLFQGVGRWGQVSETRSPRERTSRH